MPEMAVTSIRLRRCWTCSLSVNTKANFPNLKVAIIGDIAHSRVARSLVDGLTIMGCPHLNLIAPPEFLPADIGLWPVKCFTTIAEGLAGADIIVALRFQWERMMVSPSLKNFRKYGENTS